MAKNYGQAVLGLARCKKCNEILTDDNYADSVGFAGYCYKCEVKILRAENKENKKIGYKLSRKGVR